ncbi:helix-turn-helix domain-containing protein [Olleya marilimosa]|uniref:Helix-turn-helix transcriptional regulator n=1 Tax=Olleya marilimosa TaxID=272164 RepID=A0ABR8LXV5_9FLAO|nr:AraC family transcriptional regulator [Olleya marilimosa]MBD3862857.1 helix-turn-helix transcriptional regulator [Olleya marilimosa]MBD3890352.1 helix-turn-helix transcriptional regulator [Olleya marilimosa]
MLKTFTEFSTNATLKIADQSLLQTFTSSEQIGLYTFIISGNNNISVLVDGVPVVLKPHQILSLTPIQYFQFIEGDNSVVYQFNREFYCIKDHDKEVGCAGVLFFGNDTIPIISLNKNEQHKFNVLHDMFLDEIETEDTIQAEMLRMLLARFIIKTTRLLKNETPTTTLNKATDETLRQFNLLVETHFKEAHQVSFYAEKLFKSPKTLSNSFAKLGQSPLKIIHERLVLETKRQLMYTDKTAKQIAYDIGFDDASHLSRLFKKQTSITLSDFKKGL